MTSRMPPRLEQGRLLVALGLATVTIAGCAIRLNQSSPPPYPSLPPPSTSYPTLTSGERFVVSEYPVPAGSHPHDVAPATDGGVWYTGQRNGTLGHLSPTTGRIREIPLRTGSAPHGVITSSEGVPWVTDGGLNAIVRVNPVTDMVTVFPMPAAAADANLNTATFDSEGVLWFTGQNGVYGRLDPDQGRVEVFAAPRGPGPYGIATTPDGEVWYASLAGSHIARIDRASGEATIEEPPTPGQGARRIWAAPDGRLWVAEWNAGQVAVHDPATASGMSGGCRVTVRSRTPCSSTSEGSCG
jgi:virginiamycin B lyase